MPTDFNLAICVPLWFEGGYVNDPKDPGGETKYGITKANYPELDIADLTVQDAKRIYEQEYWASYNLYKLDNLIVATKVLDIAINQGQVTAVEMLQKVLGVNVDGQIGPRTCHALRVSSTEKVVDGLREAAWNRHAELIRNKPEIYGRYSRGWKRRDKWPYSGGEWPYLPL